MAAGVQVNSKEYWQGYVNTAQADAGTHLEIPESALSQLALVNIPAPFQCMHYSYSPTIIDLSSHVHQPIRQRSEEEQHQDQANRATCLGLIAAAVGALVSGYFWTVCKKSYQAVNLTNHIKQTLEAAFIQNSPLVANKPIYRDIYALVKARNLIETREWENARNQLISAISVFVGGISAALGGIMMISTLITIGYVAIVAGGVFFLLNLGLHWSDSEENREEYRAITGYRREVRVGYANGGGDGGGIQRVEGLAEKVRNQFFRYTDNMELHAGVGPQPQQDDLFPEGMFPVASLPRYQPVRDDEYQPGCNPYAPSAPPLPLGESEGEA